MYRENKLIKQNRLSNQDISRTIRDVEIVLKRRPVQRLTYNGMFISPKTNLNDSKGCHTSPFYNKNHSHISRTLAKQYGNRSFSSNTTVEALADGLISHRSAIPSIKICGLD